MPAARTAGALSALFTSVSVPRMSLTKLLVGSRIGMSFPPEQGWPSPVLLLFEVPLYYVFDESAWQNFPRLAQSRLVLGSDTLPRTQSVPTIHRAAVF